MSYSKAIRPFAAVLSVILIMTMALGITVSAKTPNIVVNGEAVYSDAEPIIVNDRTLVPVSTIVNYLGGTSEWDGSAQKVTLTYNSNVINLWIGSVTANVNGTQTRMDVAPRIVVVDSNGGGRTMVPLRFIGETMGFTVSWDPVSGTAYIDGQKVVDKLTTIQSATLESGQVYGDGTYTYVSITSDQSMIGIHSEGVWLSDPCRYYIDFYNSTAGSGLKATQYQVVSNSKVTGVRTGIGDDGKTVRVVVDLTSKLEPHISYSPDGKLMTMSFKESAAADTSKTVGENDTTTVQGTNKYDTIKYYHPHADGQLVVAIDPGHGVTTGGKRSIDSSLMEWEFNRSVAYKLKDLLNAQGIQTVMTVSKSDQTDPSLASRVAVANNAGNVDLFVSIHANAYGSTWNSAHGWEIYSYKTGGVSERAAKYIESATTSLIPELTDRGTKTANFYVIKNTEMPAVLIEHGFYTNATEVELLKSDDFRNRLANADAVGIVNFFKSFSS